MKIKRIYFTAKEQAELLDAEIPDTLQPHDVLVRTCCSAISAGTELANYHALPNTGATGYRGMDDGVITGFPFSPGYSAVGVIEACGDQVADWKPGDRVLMPWTLHQSMAIRPDSKLTRIPDQVSWEEAAFGHISNFPCLGVRKLQLQLGEPCMVAGLGILGLFAVQYARLSGACPVLACDFSPARRAKALELGADAVFDPAEPDFIQQVLDATKGKGPAGVVEVTGRIEALQQALQYVAWMGRITLLGCTRVSDKTIDFYKYVHKRGVSLIGCHDATRPKFESCKGTWTEADDHDLFMELVARKRLQVKPFISKIAKPCQCGEIYHEIGFAKEAPYGIVFDWR